jgi:hypothetical protein
MGISLGVKGRRKKKKKKKEGGGGGGNITLGEIIIRW